MAKEYNLPYTAVEFQNKLELINKLENIDLEPTANSENLITSGAIYELIGDIGTVISQINMLVGEDS